VGEVGSIVIASEWLGGGVSVDGEGEDKDKDEDEGEDNSNDEPEMRRRLVWVPLDQRRVAPCASLGLSCGYHSFPIASHPSHFLALLAENLLPTLQPP